MVVFCYRGILSYCRKEGHRTWVKRRVCKRLRGGIEISQRALSKDGHNTKRHNKSKTIGSDHEPCSQCRRKLVETDDLSQCPKCASVSVKKRGAKILRGLSCIALEPKWNASKHSQSPSSQLHSDRLNHGHRSLQQTRNLDFISSTTL